MGVLRVLLALSVIGAHVDYWPDLLSGFGGIVAVESFFVISGFYMALVLAKDYGSRKGAFWLNRGLRIFPEFWLVSIATFFIRLPELKSSWPEFQEFPFNIQALITSSNVLIFGSDSLLFTQLSSAGVVSYGSFTQSDQNLLRFLLVPQAWTLALELFFYLLAPFLVKLSTNILIATGALLFVVKYAVAGLVLHLPDPWIYRLNGFEIVFFISGILLYRAWDKFRFIFIRPHIWKLNLISWLALLCLFIVFPKIQKLQDNPVISNYFLPLLCVVTISISIPVFFESSRKSKMDSQIGKYSYPLYLSHIMVLYAVDQLFSSGLSNQVTKILENKFGIYIFLLAVSSYLLVISANAVDKIRSKIRPHSAEKSLPS